LYPRSSFAVPQCRNRFGFGEIAKNLSANGARAFPPFYGLPTLAWANFALSIGSSRLILLMLNPSTPICTIRSPTLFRI
jgi:hypothetical protein